MSSSSYTPKPKAHVNHIGGIPIEFPYPPYGSQLAYMSRVIATLDRAQREGYSHALLESPTGTGKSLSLLCSVLAWQKKNQRRLNSFAGSTFVPEMEPSSGNMTQAETVNHKITIYYASRTHLQIKQVIREFRKTSYHVPMAVLGSRKRYCINAKVRGQDNIDDKCKQLVKKSKQKVLGSVRINNKIPGCIEYVNAPRIRAHPSLRKGGCYEVHDIEDLIKVGEMVKGCPYYGAQALAEVADIVFCPYSYIVNPQIRQAMEIDVKGNIIILDEAHNIEDIAREAGSIDVEEGALSKLRKELEKLCESNQQVYQPLYKMIEDLISWINLRKKTMGKLSSQHKASCWGADKALKELQEANISMQCFPSLQDCATMAIRLATEADPEVNYLSGMPCKVLEDLFSSLSHFFSDDAKHICDYQLVLQCHIKSDDGIADDDWPCTFSLWCLNPALVFKNMAYGALSVILTSGTLSPMNSFQSELGVQFGTSLVAPHVINVDSQLWAGVIHQGPDNYPLNASYKTSEAHAFQDSLGTSLEEICKVVPGGCLVFFPSYKLIDKLLSRWSQTGQWSRLNAQKPVFVEPRGGQDDFEHVLKGYFDTVRQGNKPMTERKGKKWDVNCCNATKSKGNSNGATLLAVCRGKVSEGIDFSDEYARTVIIVGIPFPNVFDIQVAEKKKYNDTYKSSKNLLSGNEWYCQQAFRALNQAAGRCIRHRFDYGAIIFLDERFCQEKNLTYISKWIRKSIRHHDSFEQSLEGLKSFFRDVKVENNGSSMKPVNVTSIDVEETKNWFTEMKPNLKGQRSAADGVTKPETTEQAENNGSSMNPVNVTYIDVDEPKNWFTEMKPNLKGQRSASDGVTAPETMEQVENNGSSMKPIDVEPIDVKEEPRNWFTEMKDSKLTKPNLKGQRSASDGVTVPETIEQVDNNGSSMKPIDVEEPINWFTEMKNSKLTKPKTEEYDWSLPLKECKAQKVRPSKMSDNNTGIVFVDLEDDMEIQDRCSSSTPIILSPDDFKEAPRDNDHEPLIKKETPVKGTCPVTLESVSEHEQSNSTIFQTKFPSPCSTSASGIMHAFVTPNKQHISQTRSPLLDMSVNSRVHKRRKPSVVKMELLSSPDPKTPTGIMNFSVPQSCILEGPETLSTTFDGIMKKDVKISCLLCRHPLGLEEYNYIVPCSIMSLSKVHLASVWKGKLENPVSVPVMVSDITSVDTRMWKRSPEQGIWSNEDGCVFNKIICIFCSNQENCLGLHVVATNSSNVQLQNKALLYFDRLEIQHIDASSNKELSPSSVTSETKSLVQDQSI